MRCNDPLDPGFGFDLIRLSASRTEIVVQQQRDLDANVHDNDELAALIDRIAARIGGKRVVVHLPQDTHIPERAVMAAPAQHHLAAAAQAAWPERIESEPPLRPLRLFERPEPIKVPFATVPDGPPHQFTWRRATHAVVRVEGPERIAMEWWKQDGEALTRDYFRVEDEAGLRFWIFRDGLYDSELADAEGEPRPAELVRARAVRMTHLCSRLCRDRHHHEFLVPARRIGSARLCASGERAGLPAIGIADHNTLAGVVRAYKELENPEVTHKPKLLIGSRLVFIDGTPDILVYPRDRAAYGRLCQLLTRGKRGDDIDAIEKGECHLSFDDLLEFAEGQLLVLTLPHRFDAANALENPGRVEAQPRRWRVARRKPALSRRRQAPAGAAASPRTRCQRAAARDQRGAVPPSRAPPAAGCADLHPREDHHRRHRQAARSQCGALSEAGAAKWRGCFAISRRRSRRPCALPAASTSRSTSSNTSIRTSRCRRARPRSSIWKI